MSESKHAVAAAADRKTEETASISRASAVGPLASANSRDEHDGAVELGAIERLHLVDVLEGLSDRLTTIESSVSKISKVGTGAQTFVELCRILFGGWPALGFLFLALFYLPLRDALLSIPDKVKSADEIQVAGLSLKTTIKKVAATEGLTPLGETIPKLSNSALEFLLRIPRGDGETYSAYSSSEDGKMVTKFWLPSEETLKALGELQSRGLVRVEGHAPDSKSSIKLDGKKAQEIVDQTKKMYPGAEEPTAGSIQTIWELDRPIPKETVNAPYFRVALTKSGEQASDLILKAVSASLVSSP